MNAFNFAQKLWRKTAAGPTNDPMAAINAKHVAEMKALAAQVRAASGTPNPTGNGANGQHSWSGRVMPGGAVQGAKYTPPAAAAAPVSAPQSASFTASKPMPPRSQTSRLSPPPVPMPAPSMIPHKPAALGGVPPTKWPQVKGPDGRMIFKNPNAPAPAAPKPQQSASFMSSKPNVTTTPVNGAALAQQAQQQPQPAQNSTSGGPSMFQRAMSVIPGASSWGNQTGGSGPISAPLSNTSTAFNNATGQQDPAHIITTDNGRKFNTQTKQFLDGNPGGFAR